MTQSLVKKKIRLEHIDRLRSLGLHTVCIEARCPNISECFANFHATFLILGDTCTRSCKFCSINKGICSSPDPDEPFRVKRAVEELNLKHVVVTSPTRDDLEDGGAEIFYQTIFQLKDLPLVESTEVLVPDFKGSLKSIKRVLQASPDILGHNLETVARLYLVRKGADYQRSLNLLKQAKVINPKVKTKSALILGLGEERAEVFSAIKDLARAGCDFLALGQYLAPQKSSYPVKKFISDQEFLDYKEKAYNYGFRHVEAGTYVRSSYQVQKYLNRCVS